jgi:hypothetical protein
MVGLLVGVGPLVAILLAAALGARALMVASGPSLSTRTRPLGVLIVILAWFATLTLALRFLVGS